MNMTIISTKVVTINFRSYSFGTPFIKHQNCQSAWIGYIQKLIATS